MKEEQQKEILTATGHHEWGFVEHVALQKLVGVVVDVKHRRGGLAVFHNKVEEGVLCLLDLAWLFEQVIKELCPLCSPGIRLGQGAHDGRMLLGRLLQPGRRSSWGRLLVWLGDLSLQPRTPLLLEQQRPDSIIGGEEGPDPEVFFQKALLLAIRFLLGPALGIRDGPGYLDLNWHVSRGPLRGAL